MTSLAPPSGRSLLAIITLLCLASSVTAQTQPQSSSPPLPASRSLEEFGSIQSPQEADAALAAGLAKLQAEGGGVLVIPLSAPAAWMPTNQTQDQRRTPAPPAPTKNWKAGPGVTVIDLRGGTATLTTPQNTGLVINRSLKLPLGQSLPHWDYFPMITLENAMARGGASYRELLLEDVAPGADRRFVVATVRGLFPGMILSAGDGEKATRLAVKSLGYDTERQRWYFTADTDASLAAGAPLHLKTQVNLVASRTWAHNENQTFDVFVQRFNYSQGDNYLVGARMKYMGDLHSTGGDENSALYSAMVYSIDNHFRGQVESFDRDKRELVFKAGARHADTLGSGRPIINLNPAKQITSGKAWLTLPSGGILGWGSSIRSTDPAWTSDLVGRFFTIDEPSELVPGSDKVRRWWLISQFKEEGGVKMLSITRHWWGAKHGCGISLLYDPRNFTADAKNLKLLNYIIAPGAYAWDVSDGVESALVNPNGSGRRLRLSPGPADGTRFDFEAGDPIEQAIGPDPFRPVPYRSWMFDDVPGVFPSPMFDIANYGEVQRASVLQVRGGQRTWQRPASDKPWPLLAWQSIFVFEAASHTGIDFRGDTTDAAIRFDQPHIREGAGHRLAWWFYTPGREGYGIVHLSVDERGLFRLHPRSLSSAGQAVTQLKGMSGNAKRLASNLRGRAVAVPVGATTVTIKFERPEAENDYAVLVRGSWIANHAVSKCDANGFTVVFDRPAPAGATLDWLLTQ